MRANTIDWCRASEESCLGVHAFTEVVGQRSAQVELREHPFDVLRVGTRNFKFPDVAVIEAHLQRADQRAGAEFSGHRGGPRNPCDDSFGPLVR